MQDRHVTLAHGNGGRFMRELIESVFADRTSAIGLAGPSRFLLGFGIALFDANNDGALDLVQTNGHVVDNRPDFPLDMPGLILIVSVLPSSETCGSAVARSGVGLVSSGLYPYSCRCAGYARAMLSYW